MLFLLAEAEIQNIRLPNLSIDAVFGEVTFLQNLLVAVKCDECRVECHEIKENG